MTLNKDGLEAAHAAYERYGQKGDLRSQRLSDGCLSTVITAYLKVVDERLSAAEQQVRDMRDMVVRAQFNVSEVYANWHADARLLLKGTTAGGRQ